MSNKKFATEDIYAAPGFLAYKKGDYVPESAIKNLKVEGKVAAGGTKAVTEAVADRVEPKK